MKIIILMAVMLLSGCDHYKIVPVENDRTDRMQMQDRACYEHFGVHEYALGFSPFTHCADGTWQEWRVIK